MAEPSPKNPEMEKMLEKVTGRTTAIKGGRCVGAPFGCGGPATDFNDELSRREYAISGLCQGCQDGVFNGND